MGLLDNQPFNHFPAGFSGSYHPYSLNSQFIMRSVCNVAQKAKQFSFLSRISEDRKKQSAIRNVTGRKGAVIIWRQKCLVKENHCVL